MKKLLSILLVAVMVAAMFVPVTVSATEPEVKNATSGYGNLVFNEEFNNSDSVSQWFSSMLGDKKGVDEETGFKIENDKLIFNETASVSTAIAPRFTLYDLDTTNINEFTVTMKYKTQNNDSTCLGLIIADDGVCSTNDGGEKGSFQVFWSRPSTWASGVRNYRDEGSREKEIELTGLHTPGSWHVVTITVNTDTNYATLFLQKENGGVLEPVASSKSPINFKYMTGNGVSPKIGLLNTKANAEVDYVKVYTRNTTTNANYADGQLLFSEDFSDASRFSDVIGAEDYNKAANAYGYRLRAYYPGHVANFADGYLDWTYAGKQANGSLNTSAKHAHRLLMYDVPYGVNEFSVLLDLVVVEKPSDNMSAGVGLIIADSGNAELLGVKSAANHENITGFQMIWAREQVNKNYDAGPYTYYKLEDGTNGSPNLRGKISYSNGDNLRITVHVGADYASGNNAYYVIYNKTTKTVLREGAFEYNPINYNRTIGVFLDGMEYKLDQLNVWNGAMPEGDHTKNVEGAKLQGANVTLGESIALNYTANVSEAVANAGASFKFTMNGNTTTVPATIDGTTATATFTNIAPQCIGDKIKAEIYSNGVLLDSSSYSVKEYLNTVATTGTDEQKALANATLVYGAAAQKYNNYKIDALVSADRPYALPAGLNDSFTVTKKDDHTYITAAGVHFDYVNRMYFKFYAEDISRVTVSIGSTEVDPEDIISLGGNIYQVYTDAIYAADLRYGSSVNVLLYWDGSNSASSACTYSVITYIARKGTALNVEAMGDLARALYYYAEAAYDLAN